MKKHIPFFTVVAIIVFLGYFWVKSHDGEEDTVRANMLIKQEQRKLEAVEKQSRFESAVEILNSK